MAQFLRNVRCVRPERALYGSYGLYPAPDNCMVAGGYDVRKPRLTEDVAKGLMALPLDCFDGVGFHAEIVFFNAGHLPPHLSCFPNAAHDGRRKESV